MLFQLIIDDIYDFSTLLKKLLITTYKSNLCFIKSAHLFVLALNKYIGEI